MLPIMGSTRTCNCPRNVSIWAANEEINSHDSTLVTCKIVDDVFMISSLCCFWRFSAFKENYVINEICSDNQLNQAT